MPNIFENFFTPQLVTILDNSTGGEYVAIDATVRQTHSMSSQATNFEVEDGSDLSDHVIKRGVRLNISGVISNDPISLKEAAATLAPGIVGGNFIGGVGGAVVAGVGAKVASEFLQTSQPRSLAAYNNLRSVYEDKRPLTIKVGLTTYKNMIMERLSIPQTSTNSNGLHFTASFREIRIATSKVITIDVDSTEAKGVVPENNKGSSPTEETTAAEEEKGSSFLRRGYDWVTK
jgi:hypothetical protein